MDEHHLRDVMPSIRVAAVQMRAEVGALALAFTPSMLAVGWWTRCLSTAAAAALIGIAAPLPGSAQEPPKWDPKNATPGVQLTIQELSREKAPNGTQVAYRVMASGLPGGKTYQLWQAGVGGFRLISFPSGVIEKGFTYVQREYVKGAPLRLIVTSTDQTVKAFAEVYPFPIETKDGPCRLWVELISTRGTAFAIHGDGFVADEEVTATSQSDGEIIRETEKVSSDGTLPVIVVAPAVVGKQSGTAAFSAAGKSCAPTVNYEWGPPALKIQ